MNNIVIIGAGYSGLSTAHYLSSLPDCKITVLESSPNIGGLAFAFKEKEWAWSMEKYIHHWFSNDQYIIDLAKELNISNRLILKPTKSSIFYNNKIAQMDSASSLLKLPFISFFDRIRTGLAMALIKLDKNILSKEGETSFNFIKRTMGEKVFKILWEPLFWGKFGKHAPKINAAWFCGRIQARTKKLMYFDGGFASFTSYMEKSIKSKGHQIIINSPVKKISKKGEKFIISYKNKKLSADILVLAVPLSIAMKLYEFDNSFKNKYGNLNSIGSQYFVLEMNKKFLEDDTYWLNINEKGYPFMMFAEHTNFVDKKNYNNKHMAWIGKYLDYDDPLWSLSEKELLSKIIPYLKKINPKFEESWINRSFFFREKNTQHLTTINYSNNVPPLFSGVNGLYLLNLNQIYPYDRATNHSIRLGKTVASMIKCELTKRI